MSNPGSRSDPTQPREAFVRGVERVLSNAADPNAPAHMVGPYRLVRSIGTGSFGTVWQAVDSRVRRRIVALKIPHMNGPLSPTIRRRLQREAEAAAQVDHPNLVPFYEIGEADGTCYIVSAYVPGPTLDVWLRQQGGVLPFDQAATLLRQLAEGMELVHRRGVLHCDLKPANIIMQLQDQGDPLPRIIDFGLARLLDEQPSSASAHLVAGTPHYMSPEQARGVRGELDTRTDIYSLGAILYELLTGRPPHLGTTDVEIRQRVQTLDPVSPSGLRPGCVPTDLEAICLHCLERDPNARYQSCQELADDLTCFLDGRPTRARPISLLRRLTRQVRRRPVLSVAIATASLSLLLLLVVALYFSHRQGQLDGERQAAEARAATLAEVATVNEANALYRSARERSSGVEPTWTRLNEAELKRAASLASDPELRLRIRNEMAQTLLAIDLDEPRTIAHNIWPGALLFHPRGDWLALGDYIGDGEKISVWLVDPVHDRVLRRFQAPAHKSWQEARKRRDGIRSLAISPDHRWLVAGSRYGDLHCWDLHHPDKATQSFEAGVAARGEISSLAFSPQENRLYASLADGQIVCWKPPSFPGQQWIRLAHHNVYVDKSRLVVGPTGQWVFLASLAPDAYQLYDADLRPLAKVLGKKENESIFFPAGSAQSELIAVASLWNIHLISTRTWRVVNSLHLPGSEVASDEPIEAIALNPAGTLLASSSSANSGQVFLWDVVSGELLYRLPRLAGKLELAFHPDGRSLVITGRHHSIVYPLRQAVGRTLAMQPLTHREMALSNDEEKLACVDQFHREHPGGVLGLWSLPEGKPLFREAQLEQNHLFNRLVFTSPDQIAWLGKDFIHLTSMQPGDRGTFLLRPDANALAATPGRLWVGAEDRVEAWEGKEARLVATWRHQPLPERAGENRIQALAGGKTFVVAGGMDGSLTLLDARTASVLHSVKDFCKNPIRRIAISPDERRLAVSTLGGEVFLVKRADLTIQHAWQPFPHPIEGLTFLGNDRLVAGSETEIRLWSIEEASPREWLALRVPRPVRCLLHATRRNELFVLLRQERAIRVWPLNDLEDALRRWGCTLSVAP